MKTMKKIFFGLVLSFFFVNLQAQDSAKTTDSTQTSADSTTKVVVAKNNEMPDVELKDLDGNRINIKSLGDSNKITIITFWATWCKPCIKELNNTLELIDDWKADYNVQYFAVSVDDAKTTNSVRPMATALNYDYNYHVLLDPNRDLARTMNVNNPPMIFIYDQSGKLVYTHMGYTEGGEYEVDEKLKALNGGSKKEEKKKKKKK